MSVFAELLDRRLAVVEMPIGTALQLLPEEERQMARAVARRRAEFATGRACARQALAALGEGACAIPSGPDRMPVWPSGYVGSITHTDSVCAVAVGRRGDGVISVGIDLEPAEALPDDILEIVCLPAERRWLSETDAGERGSLARAIYSAKECAFKCQFPLSGMMMEFHDFAVEIDPQRGTFRATFLRDVLPFSAHDELSGRFRIEDGLIACAAVFGETDPAKAQRR